MVKTNILRAKDFKFSINSQSFITIIKNGNKELKGRVYVNFLKEEITASFERKLKKKEKFSLLVEIFNDFCLDEVYSLYVQCFNVEEFKFIETKNNEAEPKTIFEELMNYNLRYFNFRKDNEKIIAYVKRTYNQLQYDNENKSIFELICATQNLSQTQLYTFSRVLYNYLESREYALNHLD